MFQLVLGYDERSSTIQRTRIYLVQRQLQNRVLPLHPFLANDFVAAGGFCENFPVSFLFLDELLIGFV